VPHDLRGIVKAMIHDLADLEPLLRQYDPGKILVGPLLNLWTNSSFRVFNIAGNGGKTHETIGLGFVKVETDAQRRRADIVALLESRFDEVQIFDSQLEMARVAHTLWAKNETSRFLATATVESKLRQTSKVDQDQSLDDARKSDLLQSDRDKEFVNEAARGPVAPDAASAHAALSTRDQVQLTPACDSAQAHEPLNLPRVYASLPPDCDSLTVAGLKSSTDTVANTETAVEAVADTETIAPTDKNTETAVEAVANIETIALTNATTETAAETVANTETISETDANTEAAAETVANTETISETGANTLRARSPKPKRGPRRPQRGSGAGVGGAALAAAIANSETIAETAANVQPVFGHSDQRPVENQTQSEPASSGVRACGDDHALRQRALRTDLVLFTPPAGDLKWPLMERIIILCMMILGVASVIVLLINYEESIRDNIPSPPASIYSRGGSSSLKLAGVGSAPVDSKSTSGGGPLPSPSDIQTLQVTASISRNRSALDTEVTLGSAINEPMPRTSWPSETSLTTQAAPISVAQSVTPTPTDSAERAADAGSAEAALTLGSTYGPSVSKRLGGVGSAPIDDKSAVRADPLLQPSPGEGLTPTHQLTTFVSPKQSALGTEVTLASTVNQPTPPLPPAAETSLTTHATSLPTPQSTAPAPSKSAAPLDNDLIASLIKRGKDFLQEGDFPAARLLLKRAADAGSAEAALMIGSTYDPSVIKQLGAISVIADLDRARKWYEIAADRGSAEAADRYANLMRAR
jgi:hypothetical protein